jgi:hypothetical protein
LFKTAGQHLSGVITGEGIAVEIVRRWSPSTSRSATPTSTPSAGSITDTDLLTAYRQAVQS